MRIIFIFIKYISTLHILITHLQKLVFYSFIYLTSILSSPKGLNHFRIMLYLHFHPNSHFFILAFLFLFHFTATNCCSHGLLVGRLFLGERVKKLHWMIGDCISTINNHASNPKTEHMIFRMDDISYDH